MDLVIEQQQQKYCRGCYLEVVFSFSFCLPLKIKHSQTTKDLSFSQGDTYYLSPSFPSCHPCPFDLSFLMLYTWWICGFSIHIHGDDAFFKWFSCSTQECQCQSFSPVWPYATTWTAARQAPLPMGFPRQEFWSGLPFPSPGDLPDPGIELGPPALQAVKEDVRRSEGN